MRSRGEEERGDGQAGGATTEQSLACNVIIAILGIMKLWTYSTQFVVIMVVFGLLNHVSPDYCFITMVIVLLVCDEIGLAKELLLMVFEFADHPEALSLIFFRRVAVID